MVPNGVGVCFLKSGNLEELLTSFASHCIHCCSQANSMLFPIRLHFLYIRMKQWRNFIPLFVGKHRNRHVTTPAMVGLWHGFRTEDSFSAERFSAPNPTDSARFHYFYHVPSVCQPVIHQRGRIWVARLVRPSYYLLSLKILSRNRREKMENEYQQ